MKTMRALLITSSLGLSFNLACNNDPTYGPERPSPSASRTIASTLLGPSGELLHLQAPASAAPTPVADLPPIDLSSKAIIAGVSGDFIKSLQRMQKVNDNFFVFNSANGTSWYYEINATGESGANLTRFTTPVIPPVPGEVFAIFSGGFWLMTPSFIATRSLANPEKDDGVNAMHFSTSIQTGGAKNLTALYNDDIRLIFADEKVINISEREKDRIFTAELPIPLDRDSGAPYKLYAAGVGDQSDQYWFLTQDKLLLLKREQGIFNWYVTKFSLKINGSSPAPSDFKVGMVVNITDPKNPKLIGGVMAATAEGLYGQKAVSLVSLDPTLEASFRNEILPAIKRTCVSCHPSFDQFQTLLSKRVEMQQRLRATGATAMPPTTSPQLSAREEAMFMSWLARVAPQ